jgi:A/G-specific adenine glycosylase
VDEGRALGGHTRSAWHEQTGRGKAPHGRAHRSRGTLPHGTRTSGRHHGASGVKLLPSDEAAVIPDLNRTLVADLARLLIPIGEERYGSYVWQRSQDPYVVFVAEYFLRRSNRTTVERFLPSFLERFPDARSLAEADIELVLAQARWAGMRTRTTSLPAAVAEFTALERPTVDSLEQIPHVGPYAARAVALYAFGEPVFPVDGNVTRVLPRFLGLAEHEQVDEAAIAVANEAQRMGGTTAVKHAHMGALTVGWVTCRVRRRCSACRLAAGCLGALDSATPGGL